MALTATTPISTEVISRIPKPYNGEKKKLNLKRQINSGERKKIRRTTEF